MSDFLIRVEHYTDGLKHLSTGSCPGCSECLDTPETGEWGDGSPEWEEWASLADEPSFSWSHCDTCGSTLGGDRHPAHAFTDDEQQDLVHLDVCQDCLFYFANGDIPENYEG